MTAPGAPDPFRFDYRRHCAAQDLLPQHQEDFQRLVKLLRYAPRFQLLFARIADEAYRALLIGKLQEVLETAGRPVLTADLADDQRFPGFDALETWLASVGRGQAVIHLVNTGRWLRGPRLEALNIRRNALAEELAATLLWWLPAEALERVAREAPDAWSWRGGVFDFIAEVADRCDGFPIRLESSTDIGPLTLAQRSRRLAILHQLLEGKGPITIADGFRLDLLLEQADLYKSLAQWDLALQVLRLEAAPLAKHLDDTRGQTAALSLIADTLQARGELDEALRIRLEDEIPGHERLNNVRGKAIAQSKIADILNQRGEMDAALRILREEVLPAFGRLGDIRATAVAQGKIADNLQDCGALDAALRIRTQEQLPVYERLGDLRESAITRARIADILRIRGELGEALRIVREEVLPVFERLGDLHSWAGTQGEIAQLLEARGEFDEALVLQEQRLPIVRRMNDLDSIAHTRFSMASIRLKRGDHERGGLPEITAALTEAFAIALKLGRPDAIVEIGELLAQALAMGGRREEALVALDQTGPALNKLTNLTGVQGVVARLRALRQAIAGAS